MVRIKAFLIAIAVGTVSFAQDNATVLTVDGNDVSRAEFEAIYKKNNKDADVTPEALDEYMELFINYKLKVREAEELGMDTISKFQKELAGYRDQLARPYLIDKELNDNLLKEAYDRKQKEIRASHILVQVAGQADPADTLAAWNRITALRKRIVEKGEDFAAVAKSKGGSDDPSVKDNAGDLGWFTALQMVYPFESMAYNTPVGEVSMPIRTRFGYHIIKVQDVRPARGEIKTAHIMLRSTDEDDEAEQAEVEKKIREIHSLVLKEEETFADLALKFSEDPGSSSKGGELPKFGTGKMVEAFENVAFSLKSDGDVSEPFRTQYGWHIVKRLSYEPIPEFKDMKGQLKSRISKDSRAEMTQQSFIKRLKKEYGLKTFPKNLKKVKKTINEFVYRKGNSRADTVLRPNARLGDVSKDGISYQRRVHGLFKNGKLVNARSREYKSYPELASDTIVVREICNGWSYDRNKARKLKKPLFEMDGKTYSQRDFMDYIELKQRGDRKELSEGWKDDYVDSKFNAWIDDMVVDYENSILEKKYPEFRMLMKEYRDGILLFELTDEMVWSKAVSDTIGLQEFHEKNANLFMWPDRWNATIYKCDNKKVADMARRYIRLKKSQESLLKQANRKSSLALHIESGTFTAEEKPFLKGLSESGISNNMDIDGSIVFVDVEEFIPAMPKALDEAKGMVTAAYQDHLEKEWVKELRSKYDYKVNKDVLYSINQ